MASGWTNKGKYNCLVCWLDGGTVETNYYMALLDDATSPSADTNVMSDHTEIAAGNGYTAGGGTEGQLTPGTDFDNPTEDDTLDIAYVQAVDCAWTASGGSIPSNYPTTVARWAVLTDDEATVANRSIFIYWDLVSGRSVSDGQTLTIQNAEVRLTE